MLGRFQDRAVQIELLREVRDELAAQPDGPRRADGARARCSTRWSPTSRRRADEFAERFAAFAASRSAGSSTRVPEAP